MSSVGRRMRLYSGARDLAYFASTGGSPDNLGNVKLGLHWSSMYFLSVLGRSLVAAKALYRHE